MQDREVAGRNFEGSQILLELRQQHGSVPLAGQGRAGQCGTVRPQQGQVNHSVQGTGVGDGGTGFCNNFKSTMLSHNPYASIAVGRAVHGPYTNIDVGWRCMHNQVSVGDTPPPSSPPLKPLIFLSSSPLLDWFDPDRSLS